MRSAAIAVYVALLALFAVFIAGPFLGKQHDTPTEVPSPPPLAFVSLDTVKGGGRLCMTDVALARRSREMRFQIGTFRRPGPPLVVSIRGAGYRMQHRVGAGYADNLVHRIALPPPPRDELVTVCVRDAGRRKIAFYAAGDHAQSRVNVFVDGKRAGPTPTLSFHEAGTASIEQNAGLTARRLATFRGVFGHAWIMWTLAVLFVLGVPLLAGAALWTAARRT
jgi:hypothetical protein